MISRENISGLELSVLDEPGAEVIDDILKSLVAFNERSFGTPRRSRLILAQINGERVGGISFWWYEPDAGIDYLFVEEKWRKQGIGRRMLLAAEQELKKHNCRQVTVNTYANMAPDYYPLMGYKLISTASNCLLGHDFLTFRKELKDTCA